MEHRGAEAKLTELGDAEFPHQLTGYSLNGHRLTAARERFACDDCHAGDISTFDLNTCDACHRQVDLAFSTAHTLSYGTACLDCHDGVDRFGKDFDHNQFPFQIKGRHIGLACDKCHYDARGLGDFPVTLQDCHSCHQKDEPHQGRLGLRCADCHTEEGWTPASFDHNLSLFKLEGEHREASCESCHSDKVFLGTPTDCYSCHQDRTIRVVGWTNEENGLRGGTAYRDTHRDALDRHVLAIESDAGVFTPHGFGFTGSDSAYALVRQVGMLLEGIAAGQVTRGGGGADIGPIMREGVPGMGLDVDGTRYFWYHHSDGDTLDKLDAHEMNLCVAALAVMAYVVADLPEGLPR